MKHFFLTALTLLVGAVMASAQGFRAITPYTSENGKLITTIVVNGIEGRFLIDTGAPCCISHSFAQKTHIKPGIASKAQDSNGQAVATSVVGIDSLRIGRTTFRRLDAMQWEAGSPTEQFGIDGIIGYNLFRMGVVKFDARQQLFIFAAQPDQLGLRSECALPLIDDPFVPRIALPLTTIDTAAKSASTTTTDTVMFDSGAFDFYEMSTHSFQRLRHYNAIQLLASATGVLSMGAAGFEQPSLKHRVKVNAIPLSGIVFRDVPSITTDAADSRLGTQLLQFGDVAIDYRHRKFYFQPFASPGSSAHNTTTSPNLYQPEWDVVPTLSPEGNIVAGIVWDSSLPIRQGDRILAINGTRFSTPLPFSSVTTTPLLSMPGDKAKLTFLHAKTGKEKTITIRKR